MIIVSNFFDLKDANLSLSMYDDKTICLNNVMPRYPSIDTKEWCVFLLNNKLKALSYNGFWFVPRTKNLQLKGEKDEARVLSVPLCLKESEHVNGNRKFWPPCQQILSIEIVKSTKEMEESERQQYDVIPRSLNFLVHHSSRLVLKGEYRIRIFQQNSLMKRGCCIILCIFTAGLLLLNDYIKSRIYREREIVVCDYDPDKYFFLPIQNNVKISLEKKDENGNFTVVLLKQELKFNNSIVD